MNSSNCFHRRPMIDVVRESLRMRSPLKTAIQEDPVMNGSWNSNNKTHLKREADTIIREPL